MRRRRDESGVIAIIVAVLSVVLLMSAAFAVDIAMQVNRKHQLNDTLDAAAQAGAFELPGATQTAENVALEFAKAHDPTETGALAPNVDFWCVVASKKVGTVWQVETTQIPSTCYPGTTPYTVGANYKSTGRKISCSSILCAIPCVQPTPNTGTPKIACNTIRVFQGRDVPFAFAPAGGIPKGSTGALVSVACKGSCGTLAPNPMDVAVVADRTMSMDSGDVTEMISGIEGMLKQMTPSQQYVALGTIGRSSSSGPSQSGSCTSGQLTHPSNSVTSGAFVPVSFSNNYVNGSGALQTGSTLVKGIRCLTNQSPQETGTSLAAPMKAAARYLLGTDPNNLSSLPAREDPVTKVLIFETDGQPNERISYTTANQFNRFVGSTLLTGDEPFASQMSLNPSGSTSTQSDSPIDTVTSGNTITRTVTHNKTVTYNYNGGNRACQNLIDVAANAKAQNIKVITIAYNLGGKQCNEWDGIAPGYENRTNYTADTSISTGPEPQTSTTQRVCDSRGRNCENITTVTKYRTRTTTKHVRAGAAANVTDVLAQAASAKDGVASVANNSCLDSASRAAENADGDYFFCAASGTDMAPIFQTALSQVSKGIKLMRMP
jgi:Flp pilus assembly protein TadG